MMLDRNTYEDIYRQLNSYRDIDRMRSRYPKMDPDLFLVLYTQKLSRTVIQNFHRIKNRAPRYADSWKKGRTLMDISQELDFPPVMTAYIVLNAAGFGKRTFRRMINDPPSIEDRRLRKELSDVRSNDPVYSPEGNQVQKDRGVWGEDRLKIWLDGKKVEYRREEDLRGEGKKTPDFLLKSPIYYRGEDVNWIESKASFGDEKEVKKNITRQLTHYKDLFGGGMVIYWFGIIDTLPLVDGILIETDEVLQDRWDIPSDRTSR
jgi:hypothetical protein